MTEAAKHRHGSPWDRGSADSFYSRGFDPHYFKGPTHFSDRVEMSKMTVDEIVEYSNGYKWNEENGEKKDYGSSD
jgi:hypothetical protein